MLETHKDELQEIAPLDAPAVPLVVELQDQDDEPSPAPKMPGAGRMVGHPLSDMFVIGNRLLIKRMFPEEPLTQEEMDQLGCAMEAIEDFYAPELSGPWLLWGNLAVSMGAVYGGRVLNKRERIKRELSQADPGVNPDHMADRPTETPEAEIGGLA